MGVFDIKHWLVLLVVVVLVFGTKRLKNAGSDLGEAIRSFRKAVRTEDEAVEATAAAKAEPVAATSVSQQQR
ncbi:twin-arginine translocase TatA/TatE family subunit [Pseudomonas anguilliseptica]|uniref:twin-arginine translocase TatA/TatE family subunit n=1 Tax=Pseudomonas anguilliseptica TaxID=53406 RepID=UPI002D80BA66|nr:twin-arginine translocase TatA/TatE family subunit [Pseudomonas anguilliseptica]MCE5363062.1 twin-arginine translocase TatA/TatE family subunit [Pseudomonas anguilliseptica]